MGFPVELEFDEVTGRFTAVGRGDIPPIQPAGYAPAFLGSSMLTATFPLTNAFQQVTALNVPVNVPDGVDVKVTFRAGWVYAGSVGGNLAIQLFEDQTEIGYWIAAGGASAANSSVSAIIVANRSTLMGLTSGLHTYSIQASGPATGGPAIEAGANILATGINDYPTLIVEAL